MDMSIGWAKTFWARCLWLLAFLAAEWMLMVCSRLAEDFVLTSCLCVYGEYVIVRCIAGVRHCYPDRR